MAPVITGEPDPPDPLTQMVDQTLEAAAEASDLFDDAALGKLRKLAQTPGSFQKAEDIIEALRGVPNETAQTDD